VKTTLYILLCWYKHLWVQRSSFGFCTSHWYGVASLQAKVVFVLCNVQCVMCCDWGLNAGPEGHSVATGCCVISWFTSVFLRTLNLCFGLSDSLFAVPWLGRLDAGCHRRDQVSIPVRYTWDSWFARWNWDTFSPLVLRFSPPVLHTGSSIRPYVLL